MKTTPSWIKVLLPSGLRKRLRWIKTPHHAYVKGAVLRAARGRVIAGPFAGMQLRGDEPFMPYWLGSYELETHPALERLIAERFGAIVDVGAAEGYLAIGLARRCPEASIVAFEMDEARCKDLLANAGVNGVADRIMLRGKCEPEDLGAAIPPGAKALVIMDVEGYELRLLDPRAVPALAGTTIFLETHDFIEPGCAQAIRDRFAATHRIESISTRPRTPEDFPIASLRSSARLAPTIAGVMDELRPAAQEFLILTPLASPAP